MTAWSPLLILGKVLTLAAKAPLKGRPTIVGRRFSPAWVLFVLVAPALAAPDPPNRSYYVYVCAESEDEVAVVRYGPDGLEVVKTITVGSFPTETEGPHGINVDPDGRHWVRVDRPRLSVRERAQV